VNALEKPCASPANTNPFAPFRGLFRLLRCSQCSRTGLFSVALRASVRGIRGVSIPLPRTPAFTGGPLAITHARILKSRRASVGPPLPHGRGSVRWRAVLCEAQEARSALTSSSSLALSADVFARRSSCANNLKQWGLAINMYAGDNQNSFPDLTAANTPNSTGVVDHIASRPVELYRPIISGLTKRGETVLDCMMGSGSTGAAAVQLGRNYIGMELSKNYFKLAKGWIYSTKEDGASNDSIEALSVVGSRGLEKERRSARRF